MFQRAWADGAPLGSDGHALQEVVSARLVEALLQDLDALLDVTQLLAVALDLVLDVGQLAGGVHLQLLQHALLALAQEAVEALKGIADGGAQTLGGGLKGLRQEGKKKKKKTTQKTVRLFVTAMNGLRY